MKDRIIHLLTQHPQGIRPSQLFFMLGLKSVSLSDEMRKTLSEMESASIIEKIFIAENVYIWRITA